MNLAVIGSIDLLEQLYGHIWVSFGVWQELMNMAPQKPGIRVLQQLPWIEVRTVSYRPLVDVLLEELDRGEAEAIGLAVETQADLLLMDERRGRRVASRLGLKVVGLLGILVEAKRKKLIPVVKPVLDRLVVQAGFWVSPGLYARVLQEVGE